MAKVILFEGRGQGEISWLGIGLGLTVLATRRTPPGYRVSFEGPSKGPALVSSISRRDYH
jgi:hypothetical protein